MPSQTQISALVTAFELWRNNKKDCKTPTPKPLREQAVSLLNLYMKR